MTDTGPHVVSTVTDPARVPQVTAQMTPRPTVTVATTGPAGAPGPQGPPGPPGPVGPVNAVSGIGPDGTGNVDISGAYASRQSVRSVDPVTTNVYDEFATAAAGSIPNTPTGHPYTVSSSGGQGAAGASVVSGYLTANAPVNPQTVNSAYCQIDVGAGNVPKTFQIRFVLDQAACSVTMIATQASRIVVGDAWLHLEIHNNAWNLTYITAGPTFNPIASGNFTTALPTGTGRLYTAKWQYDPVSGSLNVALPAASSFTFGPAATDLGSGGTLLAVSDPNVAANIGRYLMLEPYSNTTGVGTRYKSWSAGVDLGNYPTPFATARDLAASLAPFSGPQPKTLVLTADQTYASNAGFNTIAALQHTIDQLNTLYLIDGEIYYDSATGVQMHMALQMTSNAAQWGNWSVEAADSTVSAVNGTSNHWTRAFGSPIPSSAGLGTAGANVIMRARLSGSFKSSAAGTGFLVPQFGQGTSSATVLTIRTGSWIRVTPITSPAA
jgi:hypothetical protein